MPRLRVPATLAAAAVAASLLIATPAQAATSEPTAASCHDSGAVHRAKVKERAVLAKARSTWRTGPTALNDQLTTDTATAATDHANAASLPELLAYDDAKVARDHTEIASVTDAIAWATSDRDALAKCGKAAGKRATRSAALHTIRFAQTVGKAELTVDTAKLAYDQRTLTDAQAAGNTAAAQAAQAAITADTKTIKAVQSLLTLMDKLLAKLQKQG